MSDLGSDSVTELGRASRSNRSVSDLGGATRTNVRTNELTKKALRSDQSSRNATPAGGHKDSTDLDGLETDFILPDPGKRAPVVRRGEREPISNMVRKLVYRRDGWTCQVCRRRPFGTQVENESGALHLDHIIPWSAGGSDRSDNLRTLCERCNLERSNFVRDSDRPAMPCVRICAPCLAPFEPRIALALSVPVEPFPVYCGTRTHVSWAIPGWRIL